MFKYSLEVFNSSDGRFESIIFSIQSMSAPI